MAFTGSLIKINSAELPSKYIDVKTYNVTPNKRRIIKEWYDGAGVYHAVYSPHTQTEIEFSTNGLLMPAMRAFLTLIPASSGLTIIYYNDKTDTYDTGTFRLVNDIKFSKYKIRGTDIIYKAVNIVLKED